MAFLKLLLLLFVGKMAVRGRRDYQAADRQTAFRFSGLPCVDYLPLFRRK